MSAQFEPGRMSKFIKGQTIRCINDKGQGTTANESLAYGAEYVVAQTSGFGVRLADGDAFWDEDRFTAVLAPEPEDKDDLYVEPEPLKEGTDVLIWAKFGRVDKLDVAHVEMLMPDGRVHDGYTRPDAIVRPDAGQVPPWVKAARCTSLYDSGAGNSLMRCEHEAGHQAKHVVGWVAWTDAEAYGRVEVSS